jgi:hypothetical protein
MTAMGGGLPEMAIHCNWRTIMLEKMECGHD